jgi:glycosyltransferase involved in cell wall biosynthesis
MIEFIIPSFERPDKLMTLLYSLISQTNDNWIAHVVADAMYDGLEKIINHFDGNEKIKFSILNGPHKDWGHTARNYGLERVSKEWVVMTGDDNYYVPVFVDEFLKIVENNKASFVYCDMIHNWNGNNYLAIKCHPSVGRIDVGNFMAKSEFAKQLKLDTSLAIADGLFVEEYIRRFKPEIKYIQKFLYVHN